MNEILGNILTTPINPDAFGGGSGGSISIDQTYNPNSANPQSGIAVAEAVRGNQNIHAQYFDVNDDGVVSLKPEYRGACTKYKADKPTLYTYAISDNGVGKVGSKYEELPEHIIIPESVGDTVVTQIAVACFMEQLIVKSITLPDTVNELPQYFCNYAFNLEQVYNTENISVIGSGAFQQSKLKSAEFKNLKSLSSGSFSLASSMRYINIGDVEEIPNLCFEACTDLNVVFGNKNITKIGNKGLGGTKNLRRLPSIASVTSIGKSGLQNSKYDYDWDSLSSTCTFDTLATPKQIWSSVGDIWSGCTKTVCENPTPSIFCQEDPRWANKPIGTSGEVYSDGCVLFSVLAAYCGYNNLKIDTIAQFEEICAEIERKEGKNPLNEFEASVQSLGTNSLFLELLGLNGDSYQANAQDYLQEIYDELAAGKYVVLATSNGQGATGGHAILLYGVKENGEIMYCDSSTKKDHAGIYDPERYSAVIQNITAPANYFTIISKT